jgi:hypothetical protein
LSKNLLGLKFAKNKVNQFGKQGVSNKDNVASKWMQPLRCHWRSYQCQLRRLVLLGYV